MSCKFTVRFAPDSLADYEDCIVVESEGEHILVVPIQARRPPPVLTRESFAPTLKHGPLGRLMPA